MNFLKRISRQSLHSLYRESRLNSWKRQSREAAGRYFSENAVRKLHIGCGGAVKAGWLNTDIERVTPEVIHLDAGSRFPYPDASFAYVFSEHVFEHLNLDQQLTMLSELARVMKPGGKARIATPNLDALLAIRTDGSVLVKDYIKWSADVFFPGYVARLGDEARNDVFVINNYFYSWGHQFIHNPGSFEMIVRKMGFSKIGRVRVHESADPVLQNLESHGKMITDRFNEMETMVFEIEK